MPADGVFADGQDGSDLPIGLACHDLRGTCTSRAVRPALFAAPAWPRRRSSPARSGLAPTCSKISRAAVSSACAPQSEGTPLVTVGQCERTSGPRGLRAQQRSIEVGRDCRQLGCRRSGRFDVIGGQHDLGIGRQEVRSAETVGLGYCSPDRTGRSIDVSLGQPEQSLTGLW
jgi:hypothetical protein